MFDYYFIIEMYHCPYCSKPAPFPIGIILPDRRNRTSAWHPDCAVRFIECNSDKCNVDEVITSISEGPDDDGSFEMLIKKVNAAEEQLNYKKIILTA